MASALVLLKKWHAPILIFFAAILGLAWSWGKWPDAILDFGRELYVPWALTQGNVLYRDIISFNGPLSPYLISRFFSLFNTSLSSLVIVNFLILLAGVFLIYKILSIIGNTFSALIASLTFLGCFAFGEQIPVSNFNWITPYSHELTHGIFLSICSIYLLYLFALDKKSVWLFFSGLILGFVFLTKAEIFLAAFVASAAGLFSIFYLEEGKKRTSSNTFLWVLGAVIPIAASFSLFLFYLTPHDALYSTFGTWPYIFNSSHRDLLFFKKVMGTENFSESLKKIVSTCSFYFLLFGSSWAIAIFLKRGKKYIWLIATISFAATTGFILTQLLNWGNFKWYYAAKPYQLFLFAILIGLTVRIIKKSDPKESQPALILTYSMALFSFILLGKIFFNIRIAHYGFALAMPATLIVVTAMFCWIPAYIKKRGGEPLIFFGAIVGPWLVTVLVHISVSNHYFSLKQNFLGNEKESFKTDAHGKYVNEAIKIIASKKKEGETLSVLPEGMMMNYMLRMKSPSPFVQFTPPLIHLFGEEKMVESLRNSPPEWIVLIHRDDSEYGAQFFGKDYGKLLMEWIKENYRVTDQIGATPFQNKNFGILILKRLGSA